MAKPRIIIDIDSKVAQQAKKEIARIEKELATANFKVLGLGEPIVVNGEDKEVPKTVYQAYREMRVYLQDPVRALAVYYAHFRVAMRPEHDRPSRHQGTREFYQAAAARKGSDIFPDDPAAAEKFDNLSAKITEIIAKERAPEQKEYLQFQEKLKTEVNNIQTVKEGFESLNTLVKDMGFDLSQKDMLFLNRVFDRMQTAISKKDVHAFAADASLVLNCMLWQMETEEGLQRKDKPRVEAQIQDLISNIRTFANHHSNLMISLEDKKNALYISSALRAAAVVSTGPVSHLGGGDLANKVLGAGYRAGTKSAIDASVEAENDPQIDRKKYNPADVYAQVVAGIKADVQNPASQKQLIQTVAFAITTALFPGAAVPIVAYKVGSIAQDSLFKHKKLERAEEKALREKVEHEGQMQKYLSVAPQAVHKSYQSRIDAYTAQIKPPASERPRGPN